MTSAQLYLGIMQKILLNVQAAINALGADFGRKEKSISDI